MKAKRENLQWAFWDLIDRTNMGQEFPDAAYTAAQAYKVPQSELEAMYDEYCQYQYNRVMHIKKPS